MEKKETKAKKETEAKKEQARKKIIAFMEANDWNYDYDEKSGVIMSGISLKGYASSLRYCILIKDKIVLNYTILPFNVKKHVKRVVEYLCRINMHLVYGNFEFDYRDGEIRFKLDTSLASILADEYNIGLLIYKPAFTVDSCIKGLVQVMTGMMKPEAAIDLAEKENGEKLEKENDEKEE